MIYVLDSHTLIWHLNATVPLGPAAAAILANSGSRVVVPTIVLAEIFHLHARARIRVSPADVRALIASMPNAAIHPLDEPVLGFLSRDFEMHDGIIVATARVPDAAGTEPVAIVTRDREITANRWIDVVW